jgi:hypothetical protein
MEKRRMQRLKRDMRGCCECRLDLAARMIRGTLKEPKVGEVYLKMLETELKNRKRGR